jgi:diguanylate cyclase (GGDEF)-like protein
MSNQEITLDPLTGVCSRSHLWKCLDDEAALSRASERPFSIIVADLDHFKSVNDAYGHTTGDAVLCELAERLRDTTRATDLLFRFGGDEFVIILRDTPAGAATALAQRLVDRVQQEPFSQEVRLELTMSVGLASFPVDARTGEALFERADLRLHEAKRRGRCCVVASGPDASASVALAEASRLIEREQSLSAVGQFLDEVLRKRRGALRVRGPAGSGKSRFLSEVRRVAGLRGYTVVSLRGRPGLQDRAYGTLDDARDRGERLPPAGATRDEMLAGFQKLLRGRRAPSLLVVIDDLPQLDDATLELVRELFWVPEIQSVALAFSTDEKSGSRAPPVEAAVSHSVELQPFSPNGLRVWLRSVLQWDPPEQFVSWLHAQTGGLPGTAAGGLRYLTERGVLNKAGGTWVFGRDYDDIQLEEKLGLARRTVPTNLPGAVTPFVGRHHGVREVERLLQEGRLVTILGPGGAGKTRLAVQAAAERIEAFPDGVFVVPLAPVSTAEVLISTVADAVGLRLSGQGNAKGQLLSYLRDKEMLLVLDSFEHLLESAGILSEILSTAHAVRILVTSRHRIKIHAEAIHELRGLSCPPAEARSGIERFEAIQLFTQCARRVLREFPRSQQEKLAVARICRFVDGLPLGIELAAAWVRTLSCEEIAREIERSADFLATMDSGRTGRHRSLRAVFDQSWSHLSPAEADVFRKLAVFRGGFRRAAAESIAGASVVHLSSLLDKSLLQRVDTGRYHLQEVIRQYAQEKLEQDPAELQRVKALHSAFYAQFLDERCRDLQAGRQVEALGEIAEEIENVRTCWDLAVIRADWETLGKAAEGLYLFYHMQSWFDEGREAFGRAARALRGADAREAGEATKRTLARILTRDGRFCFRLSDYDEARRLLEEGLSLLQSLGDDNEAASALEWLGANALYIGEHAKARELLQESTQLATKTGDQHRIASSLNDLGHVSYVLGSFVEARVLFARSLGIRTSLGDRYGLAAVLNNLGSATFSLGRHVEAQDLYRRSIEIRREIGDRSGTALTLLNMGMVAGESGDYESARKHFLESLSTYENIGELRGKAYCLDNLGFCCFLMGAHEEARRLFEEGLALRRDIGERSGTAASLVHLGMVAMEEGRLARAEDLFDEAISIGREIGNHLQIASGLTQLGVVACATEDYGKAERCFREAFERAAGTKADRTILQVLVEMTALLSKTNRHARAAELLALAIAHPSIDRVTKDKANRLLAELARVLTQGETEAAKRRARELTLDTIVPELLTSDLSTEAPTESDPDEPALAPGR